MIPGLALIPQVAAFQSMMQRKNAGIGSGRQAASNPAIQNNVPENALANSQSASSATSIGELLSGLRGFRRSREQLSHEVQTTEDILLIAYALPVFLGQTARAASSDELVSIQVAQSSTRASPILRAMCRQPERLSDDEVVKYTWSGLANLLDLKFDERSSGIQHGVDSSPEEVVTRVQWADNMITKLFESAETKPEGGKRDAFVAELARYSRERHDQEIRIEINATHAFSEIAVRQAGARFPTIDQRVSAFSMQVVP